MCLKNRIFRDRVEGIGVVTKEEAINWGLSGPVGRASGIKRDVRKDQPYLCFADNWDGAGAKPVDFKVAVATTGDVLGRFLVRLEEMKQSIHIIEQLIENIPRRADEHLRRREGGQAEQGRGVRVD